MKNKLIIVLLLVAFSTLLLQFSLKDGDYICYVVNPKKQKLALYWKDEKQINFGSLQNLKQWLHKNNDELLFATNGGMYKKDHSPQGLFIENYKIKTAIDTSLGSGNFYMKPNGVFYITSDNKAFVVKTEDFKNNSKVKFATQSGPMLLIDGAIHSSFNKASTNLNIRNGVGILPNNEVIFAMSKKEVSFYEFADFFKKKGCLNALYLDGFVSRTYCPSENNNQLDGDFGVIIGITKK
jgi:uncharacterized protein YigE (DUF2233 family)